MQMIWPKNIVEAREMQERDRKQVRVMPFGTDPAYVAGVDAAFVADTVYAAACLYRYQDMTLIERTAVAGRSSFPYVPGYLLFLEGPAIMDAVRRLKTRPDILLVDGQGIAHPRGIGSASHIGVLLGIPTVGCAKSRLIGEYREPGRRKKDWSALYYKGSIVGAVVRTREGVNPLFVSPGHGVDLAAAIRITMACVGTYRIPEPLRCADMLSKRMKQGARDGQPAPSNRQAAQYRL